MVEPRVKQAKTTVDTTDAEDTFAASFLYRFLKGICSQQRKMRGDIMARFSITKIEAREDRSSLA